MPVFTSISKWLLLLCLLHAPLAFAEESGATPNPSEPEDDDYTSTPYTRYGEFGIEGEEEEELRFFQYGRFFGFSAGIGFQSVTGNRGLLWQGGFPLVDIQVHYWFDFHFAFNMGFTTVSHSYDFNNSTTSVTVNRFGADFKYYFNTQDLSAPITFAGPYVMIGAASYSKQESDVSSGSTAGVSEDSTFGFSLGAGLEFPVKHRRIYLALESKLHFVNYQDRNDTRFQSVSIDDLTGMFFTTSVNLLFTY